MNDFGISKIYGDDKNTQMIIIHTRRHEVDTVQSANVKKNIWQIEKREMGPDHILLWISQKKRDLEQDKRIGFKVDRTI